MRRRTTRSLVALAAALPLLGAASTALPATAAEPEVITSAALARSPELAVTDRLADRRYVVTGDRAFVLGTQNGRFPAAGFHTRGEMGGFWSHPVKLLDGLWFGVDGQWVGEATRFTSGHGYQRMTLPTTAGVTLSRTEFVPDGRRAALVGLTMRSTSARTVRLGVEAHSELMSAYPWGETEPYDQRTFNLPDSAATDERGLVFRDVGRSPGATEPHDYTALVASTLTPTATAVGGARRGPQGDVICPASGPDALPQPDQPCDDTEYGAGAGGRLDYRVQLAAGQERTVWFAVAGSDKSVGEARSARDAVLRDPGGLLARKLALRAAYADRTTVDLPGDRRLQASVEWSKQNLADSVSEARDLELRVVNAGQNYPAPVGTLPQARWLGAGFPDYPWLFGTDGEYTAFAAVAAGQFDGIKAHLRALRDASEIVNNRSGKVVHEVVQDGSVFFGANEDPGNTDETSKFPSAVALLWRWTGDDAFRDDLYDFTVRNFDYIYRELDADRDGWPEGLGNVEREGMGEEKLDNTVYAIRGLYDLADLAASKGDSAVADRSLTRARDLESRFEAAWWRADARQYADSLEEPGERKVFQRHWIGVTPMEAALTRPGGVADPGLARDDHARTALRQRERACYSSEFGLYHTGTGRTSAEGGNRGPTCDPVTSEVQSERAIFTLNTAIMAVGLGNYGRLDAQRRFTTANARLQLDPDEQPGAMPEIAPSEDYGRSIERKFTERAMVLQAWGAYGVLWPVVHQQLGVRPDAGRGRLEVVPQLPSAAPVAGRDIRVGRGSVDVEASAAGGVHRTAVTAPSGLALTVGATLPAGAAVTTVTLDGAPASHAVRDTSRGREVLVAAGSTGGRHVLVVR